MTRDETIALWRKCEDARAAALAEGKSYHEAHEAAKTVWNAWASPLVEELESLKASSVFELAKAVQEHYIAPRKKAQNPETERFFNKSLCDFRRYEFDSIADFDGFIFPGEVRFGRIGARQKISAIFKLPVRFRRCIFYGDAHFEWVNFTDYAVFHEATFYGDANFNQATFVSSAGFSDCCFYNEVWFGQASFIGYANLRGSSFFSKISFKGTSASRTFDISYTKFLKRLPDFSQADFKQAPDFDNVRFPRRSFWRRGDKDLIPKYRAIKRLAIQGHDYEREQMAFKGELRSRRWVVDKWCGPSVWLGMLYDGVADCGRSIWRPLGAWAGLTAAFAAFYFWRAANGLEVRCAHGDGPALQALYLSIKNALVLFGGTRDARVNQAYLCLYGGAPEQPAIPASVTFAETLAQTPISAALIFLLLLAVRNKFKIK